MQITVCTEFCKKKPQKTQTSSPRRNLSPNPQENRWKQTDRRVLALRRQSCPPVLCTGENAPRSGLAERPGRKGWSLSGLLIITMVSAIHSLYAQSSWDVHRGLKHRETDPERPEENVQFTPLVFSNNCASAYLSLSPNIAGYKYLTQSDARKHFCSVLFFCGCRTLPKKITSEQCRAAVAAWPGFFFQHHEISDGCASWCAMPGMYWI